MFLAHVLTATVVPPIGAVSLLRSVETTGEPSGIWSLDLLAFPFDIGVCCAVRR